MIHTMALSPLFMQRQYKALDTYNRINYSTYTLVNWMKMTTQLMCACIAIASTAWIITHKEQFISKGAGTEGSGDDSGRIGLSLTYALTMPMLFAFTVTLKSQLATMILSVERLLEYSPSTNMLPQEADWVSPGDKRLITAGSWPSVAMIEFDAVTLVYRPGLPPALREVSLCFGGREHTGVIGRTGAGKSSLLVLLFRLCEAAGGVVKLDGIDISKVGLITLRKRMAIIPQHPLLLQGSVQYNLDPFDEFSRVQLESVLRRVGLYTIKEQHGSANPNVQIVNCNSNGEGGYARSSEGEYNLDKVLKREVSSGVGLSAGEQQVMGSNL
jgi:ABC-type multidrug transport system fused ATPase/permease subunit